MTSIPLHSSFNSSINGAKNTNISLNFRFLGIRRDKIKCPFLIDNQGGMLQFTRTIGHVDQFFDQRSNGFTPSNASPKCKCYGSPLNAGHISSTCFQAVLFDSTCILPSIDLFKACPDISFALPLHLNICLIRGISGKCLNFSCGILSNCTSFV